MLGFKSSRAIMRQDKVICAICREEDSDFETRCGHIFHQECLELALSSSTDKSCPYCRGEISLIRLLELLIRNNGDFTNILISSEDIGALKEMVKYCFKNESLPIESIVEKLIALGWNVDEKDNWLVRSKRDTPHSLFYASYLSGNLNLTQKLIDSGCKLVWDKNRRKEDNESVLPHAAEINDKQFIKKLLSLGVNINSLDITTSALHVACRKDNAEMVDFLLENGAKLTGHDFYSKAVFFDRNYKVSRLHIEFKLMKLL